MNEYREWLVATHRQNGLLVDTNILLLLVTGSTDPARISQFKRTSAYTAEDFRLALQFVNRFDRIVTLHSILTETSNLSNQGLSETRVESMRALGRWITTMHEHEVLGSEISDHPLFPQFGLTDTAIIYSAVSGYLVFTDDFRLSGYLQRYQWPVLNLNHITDAGV